MKEPNYLPGLAPKAPVKGFVEVETEKTLNALRASGAISDVNAGLAALALIAARNVDTMGAVGAPSGRASVLSSAKDIFLALMPESTQDSSESVLAGVLKAITNDNDADDSDSVGENFTNGKIATA